MSTYRSHSGRVFWGLILIVIGVLFFLDRLGGFDFGYMISTYWPVIFIIIGFSILVSSGFRRPLAGLLFILFGVFFLLAELDILEYNAWHYIWPAFIILIGLWLLVRPGLRHPFSGKFPEIKDNDIDITAIFSGMNRRIESQAFRGGRATAIFGGAELDFTGAALADNRATVELTAIFGGVEIRVPRDWKVVVDATPILGGVEDKHRNVPEAEAKATLYVKGAAIFGGITIKD
jgi:predicted membrane protein